MSLLIFSNSEYFFLWPIIEETVSQIKVHKIFVCNETELDKPKGFDKYIYYDAKHCYAERWTNDILPNIVSEYILVVHDVHIIVGFDEDFFFKNLQIMHEHSIDRYSMNVFNGNDTIRKNDITLCYLNTAIGNTFTPYDVCPALWKTQSFKLLFENFPQETYRTSELNKNLQNFCRARFKCVGIQKTSSNNIYYCLGRPYLKYFKILHITLKKEILHPPEIYMDMKEDFIYYANKYQLNKFVSINDSSSYILTIPRSV